MELTERVVLVTGAARRVGRAIALRLAEAGCHVAVHYRASAAEAAGDGRAMSAMPAARREVFDADLADPQATAQLVQRVLARFGRLDVLVNNASVFEPMALERVRPGRTGSGRCGST